jgi:hypothetical protein
MSSKGIFVNETEMNVNVCNGNKKGDSNNVNFICKNDVLNTIMSLKQKLGL